MEVKNTLISISEEKFTTSTYSQDLRLWADTEKLVQLGKSLGQRLLELRSSGLQVFEKSDGTILTNADLEINDRVLQALPLIRNLPVITEENLKAVHLEAINPNGDWWLVDPIDGTASFSEGYEGFAVCLSLIQNGLPTLGVVAAPAHDAVYFSSKSFGAYKLTVSTDEVQRLRAERNSLDRFRFGGFFKYTAEHQEKLNRFFQANNIPQDAFQPVSAVLKYCLVAEGALDMGGGWSGLKSWDISAADIIVSEAGGQFLNFESGDTFSYDPKDFKVSAPMALGRDVRVIRAD